MTSEPLTRQQEDKFFDGISKLSKDIPIEYITHKKEFMKLDFFVDENVLIPRQDTETLVEEVIEIAKKNKCKKDFRFMYWKWSNSNITG